MMLESLKIFSNKIDNRIQSNILTTRKKYIPDQNDLFIVEFPKSGITWLSTIIANIEILWLQENSTNFGEANNINFCNLEYFVSDVGVGLPSRYDSTVLGGKIIKTHENIVLDYHRVIYLYRNPLDVMRSYHRMCKGYGLISEKTSLREFVEDSKRGLPAWKKHIHDWVFKSSIGQRLFFLSYENLIKNTLGAIREIYDFFGIIKISDIMIMQAIEKSEIGRMKIDEEKLRDKDLRYKVRYDESYRFVKGGTETINTDINKFIIDSCKYELEILGYLN